MVSKNQDGRSKAAIGKRLTLTRGVFGVTQTQFALDAGIKKSTYNQYEKAKERPDLDEAFKLCDKYGLTLDWIYFGDPSGLRYDLADAIKSLQQARKNHPKRD